MGMMYITPMMSPVKNPYMMANALKDWQYEAMYKQNAIASPATRQFVLDEVLRTNLAANGIVIALFIFIMYLP